MKTNLGELIHGDSLEILKTIPNKSIDLILTDPPYFYESIKKQNVYLENKKSDFSKRIARNNIGLKEIKATEHIDYISYLNEFKRVLKSMNLLIWMNKFQLKYYIDWAELNNYKWDLYIWEKINPVPSNNFIYQDKEICIYIYEYPVKNYLEEYENKKTFFHYPIGQDGNIDHPTVKPLEMIKQQIRKFSQNGDTVLDCFLGSGTTAVACEQLNRKWIGIEINEKYYKLAKERLKYVQPSLFD